MWLFDGYDDPRILRINLGLNSDDNITSIIADNDFLSTNDEPFELNGVKYFIGVRYIIDPTSSNYENGQIKVPKPNRDFLLQIAKLYPRKSTVVSWVGAHRSLPQEITKENLRYWIGAKSLNRGYLTENDYLIRKNEKTGVEELIIYANNNNNLKPDLDSPVILSFLYPISAEKENQIIKIKKQFKNVYEIREQKTWRKGR